MKAKSNARKLVRDGREKAFAEEWRKVKREYPLVAIRYLEALQFILEERHRAQLAFGEIVAVTGLCDLDSPIQATRKLCEILEKNGGVAIKVPPPRCRPALDEEDIERYLACLEKRISSLG